MTSSTPSYEWIFSGIGVAALFALAGWVYRHFRKVPPSAKQPENSSRVNISDSTVLGPVAGRDISIGTFVQHGVSVEIPNEDYRSTPTAVDIIEAIEKVPLYSRSSVAQSYSGLQVRWKGAISSISYGHSGVGLIIRTSDRLPWVTFDVTLEDYPILKTVRGGEPIEVTGKIDALDRYGTLISLKDVKITQVQNVPSPSTFNPKPPKEDGLSSPSKQLAERVFVGEGVTPQYLLDLYKDHTSIQAGKLFETFRGKWIKIRGRIHDIGTVDKTLLVWLQTGGSSGKSVKVCLCFPSEWHEKLSTQVRGDRLAAVGKIAQVMKDMLCVDDCELMDSVKSKT
jgi:hypothetical protein